MAVWTFGKWSRSQSAQEAVEVSYCPESGQFEINFQDSRERWRRHNSPKPNYSFVKHLLISTISWNKQKNVRQRIRCVYCKYQKRVSTAKIDPFEVPAGILLKKLLFSFFLRFLCFAIWDGPPYSYLHYKWHFYDNDSYNIVQSHKTATKHPASKTGADRRVARSQNKAVCQCFHTARFTFLPRQHKKIAPK